MRLKPAIEKAAKFAAKDGPMRFVELIPPMWAQDPTHYPAQPAYVRAGDGDVGIQIAIHPEEALNFHGCVADAKALTLAVKAIPKDTPFRINPRPGQSVSVEHSVDKFMVFADSLEAAMGSPPPQPKELRRFWDWQEAKKVCHASGKLDALGKHKPELAKIHVTEDYVECSDEYRVSRAYVTLLDDELGSSLLPTEIFKAWPKPSKFLGVRVGHTKNFVFLWVAGELRWARRSSSERYHNLSPVFPEEHLGVTTTLNRVAFLNAVKHASQLSPQSWVTLRFGAGMLSVTGLGQTHDISFATQLLAPGVKDLVAVSVRGRLVWDALLACTNEQVTVCYFDAKSPLRIWEDDTREEVIWPLLQI